MTQQTVSELLILALLALTCSRFLFIKQVKADVISTVPVLAMLLSVLNIFAWGLSVTESAIFILSFFVTVWNIRAMLRLASKLVIDHYSALFVFISTLNLIITIALAVCIIMFRPVNANLKKFNVTSTSTVYTGSFTTGFSERTNPFAGANAKLTVFKNQDDLSESKKIIFIPGKCAGIEQYQPTLVKLAHDGYTVYAAEFYADDAPWFDTAFKNSSVMRRTFFRLEARKTGLDSGVFLKKNLFYSEYEALLKIAEAGKDDFVILLADKDASGAMAECKKDFELIVDDLFDFAEVSDFASRGFGPVEQTEPLLAKIYFNLNRDPTLFTASHLATVLEQTVSER